MPENHAKLFMVARKCLTLLKGEQFPACPMIAHQSMFPAWPVMCTAREPLVYSEVVHQRQDMAASWPLLDGIHGTPLSAFPSVIVVDPPLTNLPVPIHQLNLCVTIQAWPRIRTLEFPADFVPF